MDAVTYPDAAVVDFISANLVPVRVLWNTEPLASDFNVQWTPTLVTLDPAGREHHRTVGFLEPGELIPSLVLGIARWHFDTKQYDASEQGLETVIRDYPESDSAPEALYLRGVSRYKRSGNLANLKQVYRDLLATYPGSEWTKRAVAYS